jgi:LuxR family transcriptional regulator, maltose regulon positive regulatory protein
MASPLLETKLYAPRLRRGLVARPRLSERLGRGAESKLTLISAPAGFGKTTLLAEWLAASPAGQHSLAWLSLDQNDNQPASFWTYLITALQSVTPGNGAAALSLLQGPQTPPIETILATLLNELSGVPNDTVLVLDDYHLIEAHDIQDGVAFLLEHLPPQIHLVIATRADPALPLARLRARGELVEIRAADLRFTPDEAAAYLNEVMGLELAASDVAALEGRTEGWIAALQLAALSMQGRDDVAGFIAAFAGDDRYIVDYLVEEVLRRQPEDVRTFLLQTSILGRMSGPLCDAVTGQDGGKAMLEALDRGNLFLVPLDDRRRWYRYHQLFADVLRAHLEQEQPEQVPGLHRRASEWFEKNGTQSEAIRHALAGADFERAATLVELAIPAMRQSRQEATALAWLRALPDEVIAVRPVLSVHYAGALLLDGKLEGVEARLRDAELWLDSTGDLGRVASAKSAPPIVASQAGLRELPTAIAIFRAAQALAVGDVAGTIRFARQALEVVADDDFVFRGSAEGFLGLTAWRNGDLEEGHRRYLACAANLERAGYISDVVGCAISLADIRIAQGRLGDALATYEQGLERATPLGAPVVRGAADMHTGIAELFLERNELDATANHLGASAELGWPAALEQNPYRWRVAMARFRMAEGDLDAALGLLEEADDQYVSHFLPQVRPVAALRARVRLRQGRLAEAQRWASDAGLSSDDDLVYLREFEHITLARVLLARSIQDRPSLAPAAGLLDRLLRAADNGSRIGSVVEVLVLQALESQIRGDVPAALAPLARALTLAEPEGYVRLFVDEGTQMAALLQAAAKRGLAPTYVRALQSAFRPGEHRGHIDQALIEPLSEREVDVLRLLATDLDGPDIASELVVSLHTVRSHTKSIYAKLGVNNRRAAVSRAAELDLLSRARDR